MFSPSYQFKSLLSSFNNAKDALLHLVFPHICAGCGSDLVEKDNFLCINCLSSLPETLFHLHPNNPIEKLFWGRVPITHATAQYYFVKESLMQRLMHSFKYRGNKDLGLFLGRLMGNQLNQSNRFSFIDVIIPLPLFAAKENRRGFNQAAILCEGISEVLQKPILKDVVFRKVHTESQTKKSRIQRWQNMEGRFDLANKEKIAGKHVLLVDDVVTTGATLEACGRELLKAEDARLSIATLCFSS